MDRFETMVTEMEIALPKIFNAIRAADDQPTWAQDILPDDPAN
jgi:hypothetical protein